MPYLLLDKQSIETLNMYGALYLFLFMRKNVSWLLPYFQHVLLRFLKDHETPKMINNAENSSFHHMNKLHIKTCSNREQIFLIVVFYNIDVSLVLVLS